ncbi:hypothetical protein [Corynebacterium pseudodiphtheriticum]|uniref:hypothetical protein n=1 Tax=Corynebacterium pseudodiphtheriticum TaxID=37637 RepID=UPI0032B142FE
MRKRLHSDVLQHGWGSYPRSAWSFPVAGGNGEVLPEKLVFPETDVDLPFRAHMQRL